MIDYGVNSVKSYRLEQKYCFRPDFFVQYRKVSAEGVAGSEGLGCSTMKVVLGSVASILLVGIRVFASSFAQDERKEKVMEHRFGFRWIVKGIMDFIFAIGTNIIATTLLPSRY